MTHSPKSFNFLECFDESILKQEPSKEHLLHEPFDFFNLPEELIYMILKNYIPVTVKGGALMNVKEFKPYLDRDCVWFSSTRNLLQLANFLSPGWYVNPKELHSRYYVLVDYINLTFNFYAFSTQHFSACIPIHIHETLTPYMEMETQVKCLRQRFNLTPIEEKDIQCYHFYHEDSFQFIEIWIWTLRMVVRWSVEPTLYKLVNNRCMLNWYADHMQLQFCEDLTVKITYLKINPTRGSPRYRIGNVHILTPFSFQICQSRMASKSTTIQYPLCKTSHNSMRVIHPQSKQVFLNAHLDSASIVTQYFCPMRPCFSARRRLIF